MVSEVHYSSEVETRETPDDFFAYLHNIFQFDLDVCANLENAKLSAFIPPESNSLVVAWKAWHFVQGRKLRCWMNPPYGKKMGVWIQKAISESMHNVDFTVCLVAARTETKWFKLLWDNADLICFVGKRLQFKGCEHQAPFPSAIALIGKRPTRTEVNALAKLGKVVEL